MRTIHDLVEEIKSREKQELIDALYKHGEAMDDGFEVRFCDGEEPIIAGYLGDDPCDIVIKSAKVSYDGEVELRGLQKNDPYDDWEIEPNEIFAGHLSYVTEYVIASE